MWHLACFGISLDGRISELACNWRPVLFWIPSKSCFTGPDVPTCWPYVEPILYLVQSTSTHTRCQVYRYPASGTFRTGRVSAWSYMRDYKEGRLAGWLWCCFKPRHRRLLHNRQRIVVLL